MRLQLTETSDVKTLARLRAAALALAVSSPTSAQSPAIHDPAKVEAGTYTVDPAHTQVMFSVSHMGFSTYTGTFTEASGELTLDPKTASASALNVSVPVASVLTTSPKLNEDLKSAQGRTLSTRSTRSASRPMARSSAPTSA